MRGYVSETELDGLYRDAFGFIYPSFWEGFGLPLLEAMAFGCVCLATHLGASLELISDQRLTFDPYDVNQIKAAFDRVVSMPEEERVLLREQNFQFAQTFSFAKYSKQMDHVLWARGPEITRAQ
jgi:glycosyltransferase involved in cell wall biosynthesis